MIELTEVEASLILQFIHDSGLEYLAESCEESGVDFDALIEKLGAGK